MTFFVHIVGIFFLMSCGILKKNERERIQLGYEVPSTILEEKNPTGFLYHKVGEGKLGVCTASLIGAKTILTAAHCLENFGKDGDGGYFVKFRNKNDNDATEFPILSVVSFEKEEGTDWGIANIGTSEDLSLRFGRVSVSRDITKEALSKNFMAVVKGVNPPSFERGPVYFEGVAELRVELPFAESGYGKNKEALMESFREGVLITPEEGTRIVLGNSGSCLFQRQLCVAIISRGNITVGSASWLSASTKFIDVYNGIK